MTHIVAFRRQMVNVLSVLDEINPVETLLICFNIIFHPMSRSPKLSVPFGCYD